ncbi:MAG: lysylphosphatidylglycerol synthase transmembrane domain-containing protein [Nitrospinota bacterium]|nr:lysylphosphatidylglycerol synthase transmembrane domain-containing protein [Nitrospinota bacterium]
MKTKSLIIGLAIAILAVYFTVRNISLQELAASFATVDYIYLIPAAILILLSFVARTYRWQVLVSPLKEVEVKDLYSPLMIGFMGNMLPARAGEFIRAYLLGKQQNIPITGSFATIVVERMFDLVMLLTLFSWLLLFHADVFTSGTQWLGTSLDDLAFKFGVLAIGILIIICVVILMMLYKRPWLNALVKWLPLPQKWHEKVEQLIETFSEGFRVVRDFKALVKISLYTMMVWTLMASSYYPFYWAYDLQNRSLESLVVLIVMICLFIATIPTPGFVGSFHAGILIALHEIMHESEVAAVSFGMVCWALNVGIVVFAGVCFILSDHLSVKQLAEIEDNG